MSDEEIRLFMAHLTTTLDAILDKVTKLYDQTDAGRWERMPAEPEPPPRELTDEEFARLPVQTGY